jgi:cysteine-rich repeat protein
VRGIDSNNTRIIFIQPSVSTWNNIVSVVYRYKYTYAIGTLNGTSPYRYNTVASWTDFHGLNSADYVDWTSTKRDWYSTALPVEYCKNYELHRCGDSQLNTYDTSFLNQFTWEVCDDGNNIDGDGCNATCSWTGWWTPFCGDNIINDGWTEAWHWPTYFSGSIEMIEQCDDWPWDENTSVWNHDGYQFATCGASYCELNPEPETLPEELGA